MSRFRQQAGLSFFATSSEVRVMDDVAIRQIEKMVSQKWPQLFLALELGESDPDYQNKIDLKSLNKELQALGYQYEECPSYSDLVAYLTGALATDMRFGGLIVETDMLWRLRTLRRARLGLIH